VRRAEVPIFRSAWYHYFVLGARWSAIVWILTVAACGGKTSPPGMHGSIDSGSDNGNTVGALDSATDAVASNEGSTPSCIQPTGQCSYSGEPCCPGSVCTFRVYTNTSRCVQLCASDADCASQGGCCKRLGALVVCVPQDLCVTECTGCQAGSICQNRSCCLPSGDPCASDGACCSPVDGGQPRCTAGRCD
jgi:hypothetical protein